MKVLSLFDGISCGMVALERAGIPVDRYVAYEIEPNAIKVSEKNYPFIEHCGDVTTADFKKYQGFDLLIGGSPCTHWSIAKMGRETTSSGIGWELFMQYKRALTESGCKYFLYENNWSIHKNIKEEISKQLGVEGVLIDSKYFSAQSRKRMYWTNIDFETDFADCGITLQSILEFGQTQRAKSKTVRVGGGGSGWGNKHEWDMPNETRVYTTIELERLQTLPDNYTFGISEAQRRKCIGNGWTVDVIAHILRSLERSPIDPPGLLVVG